MAACRIPTRGRCHISWTGTALSSACTGNKRFATSQTDAAKWRQIYSQKPPPHAGKKALPPQELARLDARNGILVAQESDEGIKTFRAFAGGKEDYVLRFGDHVCVIGKNGAGKSLFCQALGGHREVLPHGMMSMEDTEESFQGADAKQERLEGTGCKEAEKEGAGKATGREGVMFMSFSMHGHFLARYKDRVVADVLGGSSDPLARRLIVQLGLYPLWYKRVHMLSTGEIRKVLLAATLSKSPRVLVLDKPFDGLDAPSRKSLHTVLSQLCQGFPRLLVDLGLARRSVPRTSMVLVTHRREEVPQEVGRLVSVDGFEIEYEGAMEAQRLASLRALGPAPLPPLPRTLPKLYRPQVPRASTLSSPKARENLQTVLLFDGVRYTKGEHVLLNTVSWRVKQGEVWALKGLNGAGKSTLTRLLLERWREDLEERRRRAGKGGEGGRAEGHTGPSAQVQGRVAVGVPHIGVVSTELHLQLAATCSEWPASAVVLSGLEPLSSAGMVDPASSPPPPPHPPVDQGQPEHERLERPFLNPSARLLPLLKEWGDILGISSLYSTPFGRLSQGQQKLVVIARALIGAPPLLIFDEACQGLDSQHRALIMSLLSTIAKSASSWLTLLYISHHEDEALPEVTSHVLELERGRVSFAGKSEQWNELALKRRKEHEAGGGRRGESDSV